MHDLMSTSRIQTPLIVEGDLFLRADAEERRAWKSLARDSPKVVEST
jgi:hypothetical protein